MNEQGPTSRPDPSPCCPMGDKCDDRRCLAAGRQAFDLLSCDIYPCMLRFISIQCGVYRRNKGGQHAEEAQPLDR
jgi:hypothetical protein